MTIAYFFILFDYTEELRRKRNPPLSFTSHGKLDQIIIYLTGKKNTYIYTMTFYFS